MKIIKKIAAIMLSVMMVLGMCSVVGAVETETTGGTGTSEITGSITINEAAPEETYKIYRILDLESYSGSGKTGNYAYKLRNDKVAGATKSWSDFIKSPEIKGVYVTLDGDYVTWKDAADAAQFAKLALKYAKDNTPEIVADQTKPAPKAASGATTSTVTFTDLPLGYYLVETSVGTVLALDTTKPNWEINDKNVAPIVEKKVSKTESGTYGKKSTASIGDTVYFKTTITAQAGAQNYVLHDKMEKGLTFDKIISIKDKTGDVDQSNYTPKIRGENNSGIIDDCTFEIEFKEDFCKNLGKDDKIIVTYSAILNKEATIAGDGNKNETWLKYGDKSETTHVTTTTKTYEIPVYKFTNTKDASGNTKKEPLPNAKFTLTKESETTAIKLVKVSDADENNSYDVYRVAMGSDTTGVINDGEITTPSTGKFKIQGLDADTYDLTETKQPDGYNLLKEPIKIKIDDETGKITYATKSATSLNSMPEGGNIEVENKSGSLLPSTGGMGTTLFYIFGAILVIGSGVVLITKKRMK